MGIRIAVQTLLGAEIRFGDFITIEEAIQSCRNLKIGHMIANAWVEHELSPLEAALSNTQIRKQVYEV